MPAVLLQMMQKSTVNFKERKLKKPADRWCWSPSFSSSLFLSSSSTPTLSAVITFCSYCLCVYLCSTASVVQGVLLQSSMRPSEATSSSLTSSLNNKTIVQGKPFSFPVSILPPALFPCSLFSWKLWFLWITTTTTTFVGVFVFIVVAEVVFICHLSPTSLATLKWKSFHLLLCSRFSALFPLSFLSVQINTSPTTTSSPSSFSCSCSCSFTTKFNLFIGFALSLSLSR